MGCTVADSMQLIYLSAMKIAMFRKNFLKISFSTVYWGWLLELQEFDYA